MCGRIMGLDASAACPLRRSRNKQTQTNAGSSSGGGKERKATNENYGEIRFPLDFSLFLERILSRR